MKPVNVISLTIFLAAIDCLNAMDTVISDPSNKTATVLSRETRAVAFPGSSTVGLLIAIAIPLGLPNQEVFFSYNFECNYNSPAAADYGSLGLADVQKYDYPFDGRSGNGNNQTSIVKKPENKVKHKTHKKHKGKGKTKKISRTRRFIDRKIVFNVLENKMISYGFSKACLLRAICEVASFEYGYNNGMFGDIFHILFTPTSSQDDDIDLKYYIAEYKGNSGDCSSYKTECPKSVLDFFTVER